ncbi:hypothetical protein RFI_17324 [Reticulomyxa filosa]|uniref:CAP-Gly domain-containing protein n=1 Tax=Reticulomyxa filosa TaxID=46433 RepID=X6N2F2_RETFI|nr:hypothetical protein RFI_17324 [Reticulomyxa filosa]|eukprot:ETO19894.1 hypothetical protein RFI_17324 [Reticulomyxa filosa]
MNTTDNTDLNDKASKSKALWVPLEKIEQILESYYLFLCPNMNKCTQVITKLYVFNLLNLFLKTPWDIYTYIYACVCGGQHKYTVGDTLCVSKKENLRGVIRYFGPVHFDAVKFFLEFNEEAWSRGGGEGGGGGKGKKKKKKTNKTHAKEQFRTLEKLDEQNGANNGTVKNKYYFECRENYGLFVLAQKTSFVNGKKKVRLYTTRKFDFFFFLKSMFEL